MSALPLYDRGSQAPASLALVALLQATDRHGNSTGRLEVGQWPITVGRALRNHLVLDDSHVAAGHLRIGRNAEGEVLVEVLDTDNGIALDGRHYQRGEQFVWPVGKALVLGRLKLGLRLADEAITAEEPLPRQPWRTAGWTALAVALMLADVLFEAWLKLTEPSQLPRQLPALLGTSVLAIAVWAGVWALANKLFTGRLQFWRHVRIACAITVAVQAVVLLCGLLAFAFSLESLTRFETQLMLLGLAVAVYLHLTVITPHSRRKLGALVVAITLLGLVSLLGANWLQNKRFSNRLYMTAIFPPSWRIAPAVPVKQLTDEARALRQRLDTRLKDKDADSGASDDIDGGKDTD